MTRKKLKYSIELKVISEICIEKNKVGEASEIYNIV